MSSLSTQEKQQLEIFFGMSSGYVLNFTDRTFGEFVFETVGVDIHSERYKIEGTSKARKLRVFWKLESDALVGKLLVAMVDYGESAVTRADPEAKALQERCHQIAMRLLENASQKHEMVTSKESLSNPDSKIQQPELAALKPANVLPPSSLPVASADLPTAPPAGDSKDETLVDRMLRRAKNHWLIAFLVVCAVVLIGIGTFFESIQKILTTVKPWVSRAERGDNPATIVSGYLGVRESNVKILIAEWFDFAGKGSKKELAVRYELPQAKGFLVFSVRRGTPERLFQQQNVYTRGYVTSYDGRDYLIVAVEGQGSGGYLDFGVFEWDGIGSPSRVFQISDLFEGDLEVNNGHLYVRGNNQRFVLERSNGKFSLTRYVARPKYPEMGDDAHILSFNVKQQQLITSFDGKPVTFVANTTNGFKTAAPLEILKRDSIVFDDNLDEPRQLRILSEQDGTEWRTGFFSTVMPGRTNHFYLNVSDEYDACYRIEVKVVDELPNRF
jgi:hypothetical protein